MTKSEGKKKNDRMPERRNTQLLLQPTRMAALQNNKMSKLGENATSLVVARSIVVPFVPSTPHAEIFALQNILLRHWILDRVERILLNVALCNN